ncbi:hypothetical protein CASFOL_034595 [Castilleja foliolosa]|uniref:GRF-type domain-containing protein n=1 Tax=Castilleja foliolosa TaxID=1961234 RepID=A0ABD3BR32_9LAMI
MSRQSTRSNQFPAQNFSGSRSSSSYGNAAVQCHCGIQLELVTSWIDDNPGRRFQACPNYKMPSCCGFFRWFDEEMCSRSKEVIFCLFTACPSSGSTSSTSLSSVLDFGSSSIHLLGGHLTSGLLAAASSSNHLLAACIHLSSTSLSSGLLPPASSSSNLLATASSSTNLLIGCTST